MVEALVGNLDDPGFAIVQEPSATATWTEMCLGKVTVYDKAFIVSIADGAGVG